MPAISHSLPESTGLNTVSQSTRSGDIEKASSLAEWSSSPTIDPDLIKLVGGFSIHDIKLNSPRRAVGMILYC